MAGHARKPVKVDIDRLGAWGVLDFAAYLGRSDSWVNKRITWNDDRTAGIARLPGGVNVPVHRDINGEAIIYRRHFEQALDAAPAVELKHWTGTEAVEVDAP